MLINNVEELLKYISDDNNTYEEIVFSDDFDYKKMVDYLNKHLDDYKNGLFLGYCYEKGYGVEIDLKKLFEILKSYADLGISKAQFLLGKTYSKGIGVDVDKKEAFKWYKLAAEQGFVNALHNLGYFYSKGISVEADKSEAFKWYKMAAEKGGVAAQVNIADYYYNGTGVTQNYDEAFKWYKMAAEKGNASAQCNLALCYEKGIGVEADKSEAFKWYKLAAEQGNVAAQCGLGYFYSNGIGVEADKSEAFKWYKLAAEQGNDEAQCKIGDCYNIGEGVQQDKELAYKWYMLAAKQGNHPSIYKVFKKYYDEKDFKNISEMSDIIVNSKSSLMNYLQLFHELQLIHIDDKKLKIIKSSPMNSIYDFFLKTFFLNGKVIVFDDDIEFNSTINRLINEKQEILNERLIDIQLFICELSDDDWTLDDEIGEIQIEKVEEAIINYKEAYRLGATEVKDRIFELEEIKSKVYTESLNIPENIDIFISWNHNNVNEKNRIRDYLEEKEYHVWESDTSASGDLNISVSEAIKRAKGYVILLSMKAFNSSYMPNEIELIFSALEEKGINDKKNIKIYVLDDENNCVDDVIKEIENQTNSFRNLMPLTVDFNYDENDLNGILQFVKSTVKNELFREYRDLQKKLYDSFQLTLSDTINKYNDDIIINSLTYENGYINRDLYTIANEKINCHSLLNYKDKPIIIYGNGGTGKSLYVKNLIRTNLDKSKLFFYLPCRDIRNIVGKSADFIDIISLICLSDKKYDILREELTNIFISDSIDFYFIIDALDEAIEEKNRIVDLAMNFYKNNNKGRIHLIFTTRNNSDSNLVLNNDIEPLMLELRGMTNDDISILFDNILVRQKNANGSSAQFDTISKEAFMQTLEILSDDIKKNPLLISNLIYIYFATNKLYEKKYEIIDKSEDLLISALESERSITTNIFEKIALSSREILKKLSFDLCRRNEVNIISQFEKYIKTANDEMNDVDVTKYAKELYKYLHARKIITGNSISHEIYRSYFAASYLYDKIYKEKEDDLDDIFIDLDKEKLMNVISRYLSSREGLWPTISDDLICKLDFELHSLSNKMDERNPSFKTFNESLIEMLKNDGISDEAYKGLLDILNKKILYFYDFISKYMNR